MLLIHDVSDYLLIFMLITISFVVIISNHNNNDYLITMDNANEITQPYRRRPTVHRPAAPWKLIPAPTPTPTTTAPGRDGPKCS